MRIPRTVKTVAEVIGMDAAIRLAQVSRNNQVYVPATRLRPDHPLTSVLQPGELQALQRHFGGELMSYASASGLRRKVATDRRRQAIVQGLQAGLSHHEIADRVRCTWRHVRRVARRAGLLHD